MTEILVSKDLKCYYSTKFTKKVKAVDGVSFSIKKGEVLGIAGESGCGKSTLARCLMNMFDSSLQHYGGEVILNGQNIYEIPEERFRSDILGEQISYIPQSAMNALNPTIKIKTFIKDLMKSHKQDMTDQEIMERAEERISSLNLPVRVLNNYACELSGGMKQRVIVAISTMLSPTLLIADEPTSALDVSTQKVLVKMFKKLLEDNIVDSLIFITHDLITLRHACDRIAIMYAGQFVEIGTIEQIVFDPIHPYTEALISSILVPESGMREKTLIHIPGIPPDLKEPAPGCRFMPRCQYSNEECLQNDVERVTVKGRPVRCGKVAEKQGSVSNE